MYIAVPAECELARLDVFLARHVPHWSRRSAQRAIAADYISINGRRARKGQMIRGGDVVHLDDEVLAVRTLEPNPQLAFPVLHEDAAVIAIDKPAGVPSHAIRPTETVTVANFLLARYPELAGIGMRRLEAGVVHRLDTDTSGILLVSRSMEAYAALRKQFSTQQVRKEYVALVHGDISAPDKVDVPLARDARCRSRMRLQIQADRGRRSWPAVTYYRPLEHLSGATLVSVRIRTGVTHQIRAHLASIGHPIIGDRLYGGTVDETAAQRQLLHACRLTFIHPVDGGWMSIASPLPADFSNFLGMTRAGKRQPIEQ